MTITVFQQSIDKNEGIFHVAWRAVPSTRFRLPQLADFAIERGLVHIWVLVVELHVLLASGGVLFVIAVVIAFC